MLVTKHPDSGIRHTLYNCAKSIKDRRQLRVPSDKLGLVIRRQLLGLLKAHDESEVLLSH